MPNKGNTGTDITGNASVDRDFVGRDATNQGNQVHIAMERLSEVSEREAANISELSRQIATLADEVTRLTHALIGDERFGSTGLVQRVKEMDLTSRSREFWRIVSTWMLVGLLASQIVQGWLIYQVYALYWAIYQAVQAVN